jgi:hypothetical protein
MKSASFSRLGAGLLMTVAVVVTGAAAPTASADVLSGCPPADVSSPFLPWLDLAKYTLVPNGGLENGRTSWSLDEGARVVSGNESYDVRSATDTHSLSLPTGSSATTGPVCVGVLDPTVRLFARNTGSPLSTLRVEVLYEDEGGASKTASLGALLGGPSWQPTLPQAIFANLQSLPLVTDGASWVSFRFTPQSSLGSWRIDDVYVDPFKGR